MVELLPNNVVTDDSSTRAATSNNSATSRNSSASAILDPLKQRQQRPLLQFYQAGNHGTCRQLRKALEKNYKCTKDAQLSSHRGSGENVLLPYTIGYRKAIFCPCPGGDSPSAKRFFDAVHAGCIPIVLSHDFVWPPFFSENEAFLGTNNPQEFSIRLNAQAYARPKYNHQCDLVGDATLLSFNETTKAPPNISKRKATTTIAQDLQSYLKTISNEKIQLLQIGVGIASDHYAYYKRDKNLPDNLLRDRVLPNGGAAHTLVGKLSERALGVLWPACQHEEKRSRAIETDKISTFKC